MPFKNLIDYLEGGYSLGEFLRQFPTVSREKAIQSLEEAKDSLLAKIALALAPYEQPPTHHPRRIK